MAKIKGLHRICTNLIPSAKYVMEQEYKKPNRVKLTHFWLAQQLGISNLIAFHLLHKVAKQKFLCVQFPTGPIYWGSESINIITTAQLCGIKTE